MTTFLTYSIFSLSTSNSIPMQSEYLPAVTIYYILSTLATFVSFSWFVVENFFRGHKWLPAPLRLYVNMLRWIKNSIADAFKMIKCKPKKRVGNLAILPTVSNSAIQVVLFLIIKHNNKNRFNIFIFYLQIELRCCECFSRRALRK
jgi:hypothetical protein